MWHAVDPDPQYQAVADAVSSINADGGTPEDHELVAPLALDGNADFSIRNYELEVLHAEPYDTAHSLALHQKHLLAEYRIERAGLLSKLTHRAFAEMPKLRSLIFTDFRGLAQNGDDWDRLCRRHFRIALAAVHLPDCGWSALPGLLTDISQAGGRLTHFSIGDSIFRSDFAVVDDAVLMRPCLPASVCFDILGWSPGDQFRWCNITDTLRSLHLSVLCSPSGKGSIGPTRDYDLMHLSFMLQSCARTLVDLSLDAKCSGVWSAYRELAYRRKKSFVDPLGNVLHLTDDMTHIAEYRRLETLELRGWPFAYHDLAKFIRRQMPMLRNLHMIHCMERRYRAPGGKRPARDRSLLPQLRGVEIAHLFISQVPAYGPLDEETLAEIAEDVQEMAPEELETIELLNGECAIRGGNSMNDMDREFEDDILNGRENHIVRRAPRLEHEDEPPDEDWSLKSYHW